MQTSLIRMVMNYIIKKASDQYLREKRTGNKIAARAKINNLAKTDPEHCFGHLDLDH